MNDEELVEVIAEWFRQYGDSRHTRARGLLDDLRSAGFQVFKPEDCEVMDYMAGTYFLVPDDVPADSGGSG